MPELGAGLGRLQTLLAILPKYGLERVTRAVSQEAIAQSMACFRQARDPYGVAWAPLKHRKGKALLDTGRLRASITVHLDSPIAFRIGTNVRYAPPHLYGVDKTIARAARSMTIGVTSKGSFLSFAKAGKRKSGAIGFRRLNYRAQDVHLVIPQRAFLPTRDRGVWPPLWASAIERATHTALGNFFKGQ